jgi:hypothetical protein
MNRFLPVLLAMLFFTASFAQEKTISTKEAGIYQRKSVAFLNTAINTNKQLPEIWTNALVSTLQDSVRLVRFDYNRIPRSIVKKFNEMPYLSVEDRMNNIIVPAVLTKLDKKKETRAQALLSEQQKNSFITDKAKELGITEAELNAVMNSAYIFAPIFSGYTDTTYQVHTRIIDPNGNSYIKTNTIYRITLSAGGYWWKIDNSGEIPRIKLIARIERTAFGSIDISDNSANYKYAAFLSALSIIAKDVKTATKNIPDFQLSAQVLDRNMRNITLSIGNDEGIKTDDKFWVYESIEDENGKITQKKHGWIMIKKVGEQSKAQIIAGKPYIGSTIREITNLPFDITLGFVSVPFSLDKIGQREYENAFNKLSDAQKENYALINDLKKQYMGDIHDLDLSNMYGPKLKFSVNLLSGAGGSQWWLGMGGQFLLGSANGTVFYNYLPYEINSSTGFGAELSLAKKIYFRRLAIVPEAAFGIKSIMLFTDYKSDYPNGYKDIYISNFNFGTTGNLGVEIALTPFFNIGGSAGWQFYGKGTKSWNLRYYYENEVHDSVTNETSISGSWRNTTIFTGDLFRASGLTWSAFVSFAIPSGSRRYNDLVKN